jgi:hypothetical protein
LASLEDRDGKPDHEEKKEHLKKKENNKGGNTESHDQGRRRNILILIHL